MGTKRDRRDVVAQESTAMGRDADTEAAASGLDELDVAILRYLEQNGRATNYEVGEAVGLSASAASRRIQDLEATGRWWTTGCSASEGLYTSA